MKTYGVKKGLGKEGKTRLLSPTDCKDCQKKLKI